jgi:hypothetical protein
MTAAATDASRAGLGPTTGLLRRSAHALRLESWPLTVAFWAAACAQALAFALCRFPPMIDYPQHVAMGALLHRLRDSAAPEHALFATNYFTYNAGVETAMGLMSSLVATELAGRLLFALHALLFALAALVLCRVASRPRWYAMLALPLVYNFTCGWGFANFVFATPLVLLLLAAWIHLLQAPRAWALAAGLAVLSMAVAYTHVLAMLAACVAVAALSLGELADLGLGAVGAWFRRVLVPCLALVPAVGYSLGAWFWARATSTTVWEHAWAEGQDEPLWFKLRHVLYNAAGNFSDGSDQVLLAAALGVGVAIWLLARRAPLEPRMRRLALLFLGLYCVVPKVFIATFHIYPRFLPFGILFAFVALPAVPAASARALAAAAAAVALATGTNVLKKFLTIEGVDDAMAIVDDMPSGRSLIGVTFDAAPPGFFRQIWVHLPAIYQARRGGLLAYSFTRNESVPVHFRPGKEPARPPGGFEWDGRVYDPHAAYARDYDLVLVHTWPDSAGRPADPQSYVFKDLAPLTRLVSRRGSFFLYDASGLRFARRPSPVDEEE